MEHHANRIHQDAVIQTAFLQFPNRSDEAFVVAKLTNWRPGNSRNIIGNIRVLEPLQDPILISLKFLFIKVLEFS